MAKLTREKVLQIVASARKKGEGLNLNGADLSEADLRQIDLRGANLYKADLREADLRGTYLLGANLEGAILKGAKHSHTTMWPANFDPEQAGAIRED